MQVRKPRGLRRIAANGDEFRLRIVPRRLLHRALTAGVRIRKNQITPCVHAILKRLQQLLLLSGFEAPDDLRILHTERLERLLHALALRLRRCRVLRIDQHDADLHARRRHGSRLGGFFCAAGAAAQQQCRKQHPHQDLFHVSLPLPHAVAACFFISYTKPAPRTSPISLFPRKKFVGLKKRIDKHGTLWYDI